MVNQPAGWSYWIHDCDFVTCDRLKINANVQYPNNDGIHINSSRNVTVSNCSIVCGDDCLVVRANNASLSENKVCERVVVTNCNLTSYASGIRIGWLNDGVIKNCAFITSSESQRALNLRNVNGKQVQVTVQVINTNLFGKLTIQNETTTERPNAFDVTIIGGKIDTTENKCATNIYPVKKY